MTKETNQQAVYKQKLTHSERYKKYGKYQIEYRQKRKEESINAIFNNYFEYLEKYVD